MRALQCHIFLLAGGGVAIELCMHICKSSLIQVFICA